MSNMSYCRFQNTNSDLSDCGEHILDKLGEDEAMARVWLVQSCILILEALDCSVTDINGDVVEHRDAKKLIEAAIGRLPEGAQDEED